MNILTRQMIIKQTQRVITIFKNSFLHTTKSNPDNISDCDKIIQYDTSCYDQLVRQKIFAIDTLRVLKNEGCTCPTKAFAILVHDTPMNCEDHPLSLLVKKVYEMSGWMGKKPIIECDGSENFSDEYDYYSSDELSDSFNEDGSLEILDFKKERNLNKEEGKSDVVEESKEGNKSKLEPAFEDFIKSFQKNVDAGFIPKIVKSIDQWVEFDQKFYSSKFDPKHITEEQKFDFSKSGLKVSEAAKITELYNELDTEASYYRLRLAAIAYDLNTLCERYEFGFKQLITGRFVTILALDVHAENGLVTNHDFPGILFSGYRIPSILQYSA